ncbi:hypothetical protein PENTCL1PPCAC_16543, partial [Pristionchus entomophagus]
LEVLTIHSITSSGLVIVVIVALAVAQTNVRVHKTAYTNVMQAAVMAALLNPVLTLYFMVFSIHNFLHGFIVSFGLPLNVLAIGVILLKTSKASKEYALLLLNTAIIELGSIVAHFLVNGRMFIDSTTGICVSDGPCRDISEGFCSVMAGFMQVIMIQSTTILGLSFWYRTRSLQQKTPFGRRRLQSLILLFFIPHIFHIAAFVMLITPREQLEPVVDKFYGKGYGRVHGLYGFVDMSEPGPALVMGYLLIFPSIPNTYIVYAWRRHIALFREKMQIMSVKTRGIHESFTKVLTIQAASSLVVIAIIVILAIEQEVFHLHSVDIEGLVYDFAVLPTLINPALTLYFVRTYRL